MDDITIMTIGERIRHLRKNILHLTQKQFAERIGMKGNSVSQIEKQTCETTERVIKSICKEFNVNYDWLKHGEGEMFFRDDDLYGLLKQIMNGENEYHKFLIRKVALMNDEQLVAFKQLIDNFLPKK